MAAITFDTLKFVEKLKSAGVPDAQAKADAEALQGVFEETLESQLASRNDLIRVERRFDRFNGKIDRMDIRISRELIIIKWMLGLVLTGILVLILKISFSIA